MLFEFSPASAELQKKLNTFMDKHIYPNEEEFFRQLNQGDRWDIVPLIETLKQKAKAENLWNLFLPESEYGAGLTNGDVWHTADYGDTWEKMPFNLKGIWFSLLIL